MRRAKDPLFHPESRAALAPPRSSKPVARTARAARPSTPPPSTPSTKNARASARRRTSYASHPPPSLSEPAPASTRRKKGAAKKPSTTLRPVPSRAPAPQPILSPEEHLSRAMEAKTPRARSIWARRGLASRARIDKTTHAMLLRQLYLAYFEQRRFDEAFAIAEQSLRLGVLSDVIHQDAARACVALGDIDAAAGHLRLAARIGPPSRRAFHWWTLGGMFYVAERHQEAIGALARAARWGTRDKPLYQGHLAAARCASGARVADLVELITHLREVPAGQGYGRFVLGQMAYYAGRPREARAFLEAFIERTEGGRPALAIALDGELTVARRTLASLPRPRS